MNKTFFTQAINTFWFSCGFYFVKLELIFLETHCLYIVYTFDNKSAFFVICKNYILPCFCFKNLDLFDLQTRQWDFSLSTLFVIFIFFWPKILHIIFTPRTIFCSGLFFNFYRLSFWLCVFDVLHYEFFLLFFQNY